MSGDPETGAVHPLTLRERLWLTSQLRLVRGEHVHGRERLAIDEATAAVAGVELRDDGTIAVSRQIDTGALEDLLVTVAVVERIIRARRRQAADPAAGRWVLQTLRRDERVLVMLRRVQKAAHRAVAP